MKCKNCGAPIERITKSGWDLGYWRHIRDVHMGRIWCYPNVHMESQYYTRQAEPEETDA